MLRPSVSCCLTASIVVFAAFATQAPTQSQDQAVAKPSTTSPAQKEQELKKYVITFAAFQRSGNLSLNF